MAKDGDGDSLGLKQAITSVKKAAGGVILFVVVLLVIVLGLYLLMQLVGWSLTE